MKSILEKFARGSISPEPRFTENNPRYNSALQLVIDSENKLLSILNEQQKDALNAFLQAQSTLEDVANIDRFVHTYRLAALMTMEVLNGKNSI